jgi:hypothetical protein
MNTSHQSTTADLDGFVAVAKAKGVPDDALVPLLRQNGWSERRVYSSLSAHYGTLLGIPPPNRSGPAESARDAFLYLVNFIALGFWATSLGQIFYVVIAQRFPDPASPFSTYGSLAFEVAWQIAAVVVSFPVFVFVHRAIGAQLRRRPDAADSGVRLWLTYIALVVAALVCMTDAMWFIEAVLRGELTIRFVLDSCVLAVLSGGIFGYYLSGLQRGERER